MAKRWKRGSAAQVPEGRDARERRGADRARGRDGADAGAAGVAAARRAAMNRAAEKHVQPKEAQLTTAFAGSDFMVDCFKSVGFEHLPEIGSSFRGDPGKSIVNYGQNEAPDFITCTHEEASVAMAHGYAKIEGKPCCDLVHGTVGLQHAAMAIYNAYCDRVPCSWWAARRRRDDAPTRRRMDRTRRRTPPPSPATS